MKARYYDVKGWLLMLVERELTMSETAFLMGLPREYIAEWASFSLFYHLLEGRTKQKQQRQLAKSLALFLLDKWHNKTRVANVIGVVPATITKWQDTVGRFCSEDER